MIRLNIIAEGPTEENFVSRILTDHLGYFNISTSVHCVTTDEESKTRGGIVKYEKLKREIIGRLNHDRKPEARFTTMIDLYRLPEDFPRFEEAQQKSDPYEKVAFLETGLLNDIKDPRFMPYIQLHEFEALLLTDPTKFSGFFVEQEYEKNIEKLVAMTQGFDGPELINDGAETAPSKRIEKVIPGYKKVKKDAGTLIAQGIGLEKIREKCHHFNEWLSKLETLNFID
jgi:hypothetical protein